MAKHAKRLYMVVVRAATAAQMTVFAAKRPPCTSSGCKAEQGSQPGCRLNAAALHATQCGASPASATKQHQTALPRKARHYAYSRVHLPTHAPLHTLQGRPRITKCPPLRTLPASVGYVVEAPASAFSNCRSASCTGAWLSSPMTAGCDCAATDRWDWRGGAVYGDMRIHRGQERSPEQ